MPTTSEDIKVVIGLLKSAEDSDRLRDRNQTERNEKIDSEMKHIHDCVHGIDENVKGIKAYFIGIDPQKHIIHHVKMEESEENSKDIKKALWGSVISMIFAGFMAFFSWTGSQAISELREQMKEIASQQNQPKPPELNILKK